MGTNIAFMGVGDSELGGGRAWTLGAAMPPPWRADVVSGEGHYVRCLDAGQLGSTEMSTSLDTWQNSYLR